MARGARTPDSAREVEAWLAACTHPLREVIDTVRALIKGVDPAVGEAIKWNAPSFHTAEHFATLHLRDPRAVQVILHRGVRQRAGDVSIDDPDHLLTWLGPERATLKFDSVQAVQQRRDAFEAVLRQWMAQV